MPSAAAARAEVSGLLKMRQVEGFLKIRRGVRAQCVCKGLIHSSAAHLRSGRGLGRPLIDLRVYAIPRAAQASMMIEPGQAWRQRARIAALAGVEGSPVRPVSIPH